MANNLRRCVANALLTAALAASAVSLACSGKAAQNAHAGGPGAMPVKVLLAQAVPVDDASEYVATLKSRDSAVIMPQVEGQITKIFVHSGEHVAAGAPLIEIDPLKQQATVKSQESSRAAQQANLIWAKKQYDRAVGLSSAGVVSKQDLEQAKATLDAAQAQMDSLDAQVNEQQVQLHYYKVVAPRAGVVGDIPVREGDRVTTTTQLTTVDQPGSLEAYVYVPIERSSQLKMNLPVQVLDTDGKVLADSRVSFHFSTSRQHHSDGAGKGANYQRQRRLAAIPIHSRARRLGDAQKSGSSNSRGFAVGRPVFCIRRRASSSGLIRGSANTSTDRTDCWQ